MYWYQIVQRRDDILHIKHQWQTPLVSTARFDAAQANAYSTLHAMSGAPCNPHYIWIAHLPTTAQMVPVSVSGSHVDVDGEEYDSEQEEGDDTDDSILHDILVDDLSSDDNHFVDT